MSARDLTTAIANEFKAAGLRPVLFFEAWFSSGPLRLTSSPIDVPWNGSTWKAPTATQEGVVLTFSGITETTEVKAVGMNLVFSGVPTALLGKCLSEVRQGYPVRIWMGAFNASGAVVADPYKSFDGRLDVPTIEENGDTCTITLGAESKQIALMIPHDRRWTHEDQQIDFPGDTLFRFLPTLVSQQIVWGNRPAANGVGIDSSCFSSNTRFLTADENGIRKAVFGEYQDGDRVTAVTERGPRPAIMHAHDFEGHLLHMGEDELVTFDHLIRNGWLWVEARELWKETREYKGKVYTLQVLTDVEVEANFKLGNGLTAHNKYATTWP